MDSNREPLPGPSTAPDTASFPRSFSKDTSLSPPKKRPRTSMTVADKVMVMNAYKHTAYKKWPKDEYWSLTACANKTADILGVSERTVRRIVKENKENEEFSSPQKRGPKLNYKDKYDEFIFAAIRRKVHQFFYRNEAPTIAKVLQVVNDDPELPNFSWSTMRSILIDLNFKYVARSRQSCLTDRQDIILWRKQYLHAIKQYRRQGKFIYYQDETWLNEGHTLSKVWVDTVRKILTLRKVCAKQS